MKTKCPLVGSGAVCHLPGVGSTMTPPSVSVEPPSLEPPPLLDPFPPELPPLLELPPLFEPPPLLEPPLDDPLVPASPLPCPFEAVSLAALEQ